MKRSTTFYYQPDGPVDLSLTNGTIKIKDSSRQTVEAYCGADVIDKAIINRLNVYYIETPELNAFIEKYLIVCSRATQEKFMQIMNDHIRKADIAAAE